MTKFLAILSEMNSAIRTILIVAVLAFAVSTFSCFKTRTDMSTYIEGYNAYREQAENGVKYSDSLKKVIDAYEKSSKKTALLAEAYKNRADSIAKARPKPEVVVGMQRTIDSLMTATTDSVELARTVIPAQAEMIDTLNVVVKSQKFELAANAGEISSLRTIIFNDSTVKRLLRKQVDSLTNVVEALPPAPKDPDKFWGITLPNRKVMAVGGFIGGIITTLLVIL